MGDLRERLAGIEALGEFDAWSRTDEILDAALAVFADWLRELCDEIDRSPWFPFEAGVVAQAIRERADSLTPPDTEEEGRG